MQIISSEPGPSKYSNHKLFLVASSSCSSLLEGIIIVCFYEETPIKSNLTLLSETGDQEVWVQSQLASMYLSSTELVPEGKLIASKIKKDNNKNQPLSTKLWDRCYFLITEEETKVYWG